MPLTILLACLIAQTSGTRDAKSSPTIVVNEDKDGLPGATVGPSRKEIEDLIKAIGRDPLSDELVDRVDAMFRPRWANLRKFEEIRARALDPSVIARVDAAAVDLTKKPADTRTLVQRAVLYLVSDDDATFHNSIKDDLDREKAPRKTIKGQILDDETGKPIVGAIITSQGEILTRTDAKGHYVLTTRPGTNPKFLSITIEAAGFGLAQTMFDWTQMAEPEVYDARLLRSTVFGGRIVDADGKPIVGAEVNLMMQPYGIFRDGSLQRLNAGGSYTTFRAKTEADGTYAFRNIPPDNAAQQYAYTLTANHPQYLSRLKRYMPNELLGPGWEITLEKGNHVRGLVVDEAGKPIPNVQITAQYNPAEVVWPTRTTDAEGRFRFDNLPDLPVQLVARSVTHVYTITEAKAEKDEPAETRITMGTGDYMEGKVIDQNDKPIGGINVGYLIPVNADGVIPQNRANIAANRLTTTKEDGTFRLGPISKGRFRVRAIKNDPVQGSISGFINAESGDKRVVIKLGVNGQ